MLVALLAVAGVPAPNHLVDESHNQHPDMHPRKFGSVYAYRAVGQGMLLLVG